MNLYPLKFNPILKSIIWGGSEICTFKNIEPKQDYIGESWEISGVKDNVSIISNGELAGKSLDEVLAESKEALVGKKVYEQFGDTFPLLIKFIDARDNLSIQVHPDDELAKTRHDSFGKTEMWYVVNAAPNAFLYSGFEKNITSDEYVKTVENNTFTDTLKKHDVKTGDVFFLPAGRVHAIGAGCFIAEIQQTSDITYRIYDYNRKDAQGNSRELHTELAKDSIDYNVYDSYKTDYTPNENQSVELVSCPYFTTNLLDIDVQMVRNYANLDSFVIYICLEGHCTIRDYKGDSVFLQQGESMLIPADTESVLVIPSVASKLLETYI
ncbi:MAG: class I mannose-6-phosphate isomerase [Dysgonamonadaceae bacterium]|jgi:mannose-6-phosphate isomerase|nr:class I mannose-6-phosphate isomerase [Dysgonamonadaceae bacterium]